MISRPRPNVVLAAIWFILRCQVTPGNHEFWFNFTAFKRRFAMPDEGRHEGMYYGFGVGKHNGAHAGHYGPL